MSKTKGDLLRAARMVLAAFEDFHGLRGSERQALIHLRRVVREHDERSRTNGRTAPEVISKLREVAGEVAKS